MKIENYLASALEERIDQLFYQKMELDKNPLLTMKEVFLEVALENIVKLGNNDDLVDDFGFLLDYFEEISNLIIIEKVVMYNTYICKMREYFNMCYQITKKTIVDYLIPSSDQFELEVREDAIIFRHGYSASTSGKEAAIALFKYIDDNFIREKSPVKEKK